LFHPEPRLLAASFQLLSVSSFVVNGAAQDADAALVSGSDREVGGGAADAEADQRIWQQPIVRAGCNADHDAVGIVAADNPISAGALGSTITKVGALEELLTMPVPVIAIDVKSVGAVTKV
jgi:hypothetical protein